MKILIFNSYGNIGTTKDIRMLLSKYPFPKNRIGEIVQYIENNATKISPERITDFLKNNQDKIGKIKEDNNYFVYDSELNCLKRLSIVDIDISRPWDIAEYDGSEYIQYLDYEIIDSELNYGKQKD